MHSEDNKSVSMFSEQTNLYHIHPVSIGPGRFNKRCVDRILPWAGTQPFPAVSAPESRISRRHVPGIRISSTAVRPVSEICYVTEVPIYATRKCAIAIPRLFLFFYVLSSDAIVRLEVYHFNIKDIII